MTRISSSPFGHDVWLDIARLSEKWGFTIQCVFDVGANIGQTSLAILGRFPKAKVYSFEPHPETFRRLTSTLKSPRAHAFNIALGQRSGDAELYTYDSDLINSLSSSAPYASHFGKESQRSIPIRVMTVDEFCSFNKVYEIDVLKIDTEGLDLNVLRGATGKLNEHRIKFVYTEFNNVTERGSGTSGALAPIGELLESLGFYFVSTYTDHIVPHTRFFGVHNALFAAPPSSRSAPVLPRGRSWLA